VTTEYLMIRNWARYQHYKDRRPPWVKLYSNVLADPLFARLHDASKAHALLLMTVAAELDNRIPADATWLAHKLFATEAVDLDALVSAGWLAPYDAASAMLAEPAPAASNLPPQRTENREQKQNKKERTPRAAARPAARGTVAPSAPASAVVVLEIPAPDADPADKPRDPRFAWSDVVHAVWCDRVGHVDYGRLRKAFKPILEPSGGAAPRWPAARVAEAVKWAAARVRGTKEFQFLTPERFVATIADHMAVLEMPVEQRAALLPLAA
jgi:hypothetical protein